MATAQALNAHAKPPTPIREVYKRFQKISAVDLATSIDVIDSSLPAEDSRLSLLDQASFVQLPSGLREIFENFAGSLCNSLALSAVYAVNDIPGTFSGSVRPKLRY